MRGLVKALASYGHDVTRHIGKRELAARTQNQHQVGAEQDRLKVTTDVLYGERPSAVILLMNKMH
jgi:hypothetical protein